MDELPKGLISGVKEADDGVGRFQLFAIHKHKAVPPDGASAH